MKIVRAETYSVFIGEDIFEEINLLFRNPDYRSEKIIVLVDENSRHLCLPLLEKKIEPFKHATVIEIKSGEENKTIQTCIELWQNLLHLKATRNSILINLGGGVITDMGGFVASTFKRGLRFMNVPTTLVAQVDAAIGGKVGVNMVEVKNQVGLFSNPDSVFIIPSFIRTLNKNHLLSGFAEMIKHALIMDHHYWHLIRDNTIQQIKNWDELIWKSVEIKNSVVRNDPYEKSLRRRLNFGHTIGHALESLALSRKGNYITHGTAVAMGMICETYLSNRLRGLSINSMEEIMAFILKNFTYYPLQKDAFGKLIEFIRHDKKNLGDEINFTLIPSIGNALIDQWCSEKTVIESLEFYAALES